MSAWVRLQMAREVTIELFSASSMLWYRFDEMEDHIVSQMQFQVLLFVCYDNNHDDHDDGYDKEWPPYGDTWLSQNLRKNGGPKGDSYI